jgi:hypothetical protein
MHSWMLAGLSLQASHLLPKPGPSGLRRLARRGRYVGLRWSLSSQVLRPKLRLLDGPVGPESMRNLQETIVRR